MTVPIYALGIAKKNPIMEQRFFYMFYFIYRFYDRLRLIKESRYQSRSSISTNWASYLEILPKSKRSRDHGMSPSFTFKVVEI